MLDILLIEDNPADVLLFEEYIDSSDLAHSRITAVASLREAVDQIQRTSFDVIMLDLSLPDGRGKDTLRRAQEMFVGFPVIILSGTDDLALAKTSVHEGVQDYLVKGYINETLLARSINYAIERNKLMNEKAAVERNLVERNHYLEIANRRLEQFAYTVSHNLRAPLARILGLSQVIRYEPLNGEGNRLVSLIEQSAHGLDRSIRDLMELLVIQGSASECVDTVDISKLFADVLKSLSVQIEEADAMVTSDLADPLRIVHSEPVLRSVLLNLLTNAIKYRSPQRPLSIRVGFQPAEEGWYCLSVSDNGLGMNLTETGPQLFQLFARFHTHVEAKGIGLHMIKALIEECGGHIEVESTLHQGTTFRVHLQDHSVVKGQGKGEVAKLRTLPPLLKTPEAIPLLHSSST